MTKNELPF